MSHHQMVRNTKLLAYFADFIFKKFAQWLQKFHFHFLRQSAYIMVRLNNSRRSLKSLALYHIRINSTLSQELGTFKFMGFFVENGHKFITNHFTFSFRI